MWKHFQACYMDSPQPHNLLLLKSKSRIEETLNLSKCVDSSTDTDKSEKEKV